MIMERDYFSASAVELAPALVGKLLCRKINGQVLRVRITETECYYGEEDSACHAHKGRTPRTDVMYGKGGRAYVYLCYGIHNLLNITTGPEGHPEAVLIRGVEGIMGPGKVTKFLSIDRGLNRTVLSPKNGLWLEDDEFVSKIVRSTRVGIGYAAKKDQEILWRFTDEASL
ncbi:MAG: DNA-3-methyladenine glycosylase [Clostridia bacterium]|nr:DNA-3-methyladenine glycosylase [Clostridia bacterium]